MNPRLLLAQAGFVVVMLHAASLANAGIATAPAAIEMVYALDDGRSTAIVSVEPPAERFAAQSAPADAFVRFVRFPAEEKTLVSMNATNPIAYYRDSLSGGETTHSGGVDGDVLSAQVTPPEGVPVQFTGFRYDGVRRCWVRQGSTDCIGGTGASTIRIAWLAGTQCGKSGNWRFEAFRNGQNIFAGPYKMVPSINPAKVSFITNPAYNQGAYPNEQYGNICRHPTTGGYMTCSLMDMPDPPQATIGQLGCLLTGYASALTYHGITTLPTELNDYFTDNNGYTSGGAIWPGKVVEYAKSKSTDVKLTFVRVNIEEKGDVIGGIARDAVCKAGPVPLQVKHRRVPNGSLHGHFATAWGRPDAENTFLLKDPNGGLNNQLDSTIIPRDYSNRHFGTRALKPAATTFIFPGGLTIALGSPAELLLTDSSGRRTGLNPAAGTTFEEIPGSSYAADIIDPPDEPDGKGIDTKMLMVSPLPDGPYTLAVQGTGSGTYVLEFQYLGVDHVGEAKAAIRDVPITPGTVHTYRFTAPVATNGGFRLEGGFDGGGQRPRDVNKFLSYAAISRSRTDLPAGSTTYPLIVFYDSAIIANSFSASINGTILTSLFHPVPGSFETVLIPVQKGSNTLQLSIDGNLSNRAATDTDRLVFQVP